MERREERDAANNALSEPESETRDPKNVKDLLQGSDARPQTQELQRASVSFVTNVAFKMP